MAYFEVENLNQDFEGMKINVSFSVEKSTMTCVVGPSGSGKSTVLRLISGLSTSGSARKIMLDGMDVGRLPPARRQIGMVFQNHALFNHMSVADNVAYGLISRGMKKKEAREKASDFLKNFNLAGFEMRRPETLSGGEAQRVALARTLIMNPKLVLFDEPLSALDAPLRKKLASFIKQLQAEFGFTGIMVTHDINEARQIADGIILMKNGHITWSGQAKDFDESFME